MTEDVAQDADDFSGEGYLIYLAEVELAKLDALDCWEGTGLPPEPTRGPIDAVWRAAADGKLTERELALWCGIVASRVVARVLDDEDQPVRYDGKKPERAERALRSLGLFDQADPNYDASRYLQLLLEFDRLVEERVTGGESFDRRLTRMMLTAGYYPDLERAKPTDPKNFCGLKLGSDLNKAIRRVKRLREKGNL